MKNQKLQKLLKIVIPILCIFTLGLSCFASPTEEGSTSVYQTNTVPDSGYIEVQTRDYNNYIVDCFTLGDIREDILPFGDYTIDYIGTDGDFRTSVYNFNYGCSGIRLHIPVAFFNMSDGSVIPNTFSDIMFNYNTHLHLEFSYLDTEGVLSNFVQEYDIQANSPITWITDIPSGTQTIVNYRMLITFPSSPVSGLKMTYKASFTQSYKNQLSTLVANNNYQGGYDDGLSAGRKLGYDEGYTEGVAKGAIQNPLSSFGNFLTSVLGGFLNAPLFGGITIGGILIAFVSFAIALWLLKLLAGG